MPKSRQPYFATHYDDFRWARKTEDEAGFRPPQIGALHAIGAHCSQRSDRAIITMPTGSGKTAVLCAAPFMLGIRRALVITPSRLVREQIVEDFQNLDILSQLRAVDPRVPKPQVFNAVNRMASSADWEELRNYDVVVGTPHSLSPGSHGIPEPPPDLFDLVLVDEAHHSPAATWAALLDHFGTAKQILFTATPFRADQREIKGRFAYTYDLREAYKDGIFGQLDYVPIIPAAGEDPDVVIALKAEETLEADRRAGLDHLIMVRTSQRTRAFALQKIYEQNTGLRLALVTGDQSLRTVKRVLNELDQRTLDGIICVDMFGEGFNLPALKVAALHSPHRSLSVTLQFVGRFARTTGPRLGRAAFLALSSDMSIEREYLYREGAVWQEIIPNLGASRIAEEQTTQEVLESFESGAADFSGIPDLSLYSIRPYFHVKVLNTGSDADIFGEMEMPGSGDVVYRFQSKEQETALYIVRTRVRPRWTTASHLDAVSYELYILHAHRESGYLFICSSRRDDDVYQHFAKQFATPGGPVPRGLSSAILQRALGGIEQLRFFNIGMRSSAASDRDASYVTMAGSAVDQALEQNDGLRYNRGHYFATGVENSKEMTIGVSTGSKFWSSMADRLPALIEWCDKIADKLLRGRAPQTQTGIDHLGYGRLIDQLPDDIIFVDWHRDAYTHPKVFRYTTQNGNVAQGQLLDVEFLIERTRTQGNSVGLLLRLEDYEYRATFSFETERLIEPADDKPEPQFVGDRTMDLTSYLNEHYPTLYTASFSYVIGGDLFEPTADGSAAFDPNRIEPTDWTALGVDITNEERPSSAAGRSIHSWLGDMLVASDAQVVFCDHGTNEIADFIAVSTTDGNVTVALYHCKKSSGANPGSRVDDLYEVCGQAAKSKNNWQNTSRLCQVVEARSRSRPQASRFLKGDLTALRAAVGGLSMVSFQIVIVQPGLSQAALTDNVGRVLAAADEFIFGQRWRRLKVIGST